MPHGTFSRTWVPGICADAGLASRIPANRRSHRENSSAGRLQIAQQVGMLPLTGTTSADHMREDHGIDSFNLADEDVRAIESIARR